MISILSNDNAELVRHLGDLFGKIGKRKTQVLIDKEDTDNIVIVGVTEDYLEFEIKMTLSSIDADLIAETTGQLIGRLNRYRNEKQKRLH